MAEYNPSKIIKDGNTYNFRDTTKIPLAGSNQISGSLIPATDNSIDIGSSAKNIKALYTKGITIDGTQFLPSDYIPRSGGGVMIGSALGRITNTSEFRIDGGTTWNDGASIVVAGKGNSGIIKLHPSAVNQEKTMNLYPDGTWTWTGSACVISSDRRIKDEISEIPDEVLDAWENLEPKQYKLKSDLENENDKDNAQVHYGWIAQDVESVIKGDRKAEVKNGLWSHEQWEEQEEVSHEETYTEEVETKSGEKQTVIKTRKVIDQPYKAKGDSYSLRYTECLVVECAYLRKKNKELQEQLDKLASRLDKLESASSK